MASGSRGIVCIHVGNAKVVFAGLNWRGAGSCQGTLEQSDVLLLVLGNEQHVVEEMLVEACALKVGYRESLEGFFVEDILEMFQLVTGQPGSLCTFRVSTYRQRELQDIQIQVLLTFGQSHWQGTAKTSEDGQESDRSRLHGDNDSKRLVLGTNE